MGEDEKIRQVIKKYDSYFKNCSGDVAYTATGYWVLFGLRLLINWSE